MMMPCMAPEILHRKEYTQNSDIYLLGIIINEMIFIIPHFNDESHTHYLTLDICCESRPTSYEVCDEIKNFIYDDDQDFKTS
ncbi:hypothetical protein C1645_835797 [Glomus cerebriforme]|uniref:Protein kinase domain-containing protein n=1 Tax=Glomus cerebriforme TaxID=658196 RepID=A0A397SI53_9GLOM|nr:hypothetical protein C1645_835797 [Glomus cerebriforme]